MCDDESDGVLIREMFFHVSGPFLKSEQRWWIIKVDAPTLKTELFKKGAFIQIQRTKSIDISRDWGLFDASQYEDSKKKNIAIERMYFGCLC